MIRTRVCRIPLFRLVLRGGLAAGAVTAHVTCADAVDSQRLREITAKWQKSRAQEQALGPYLRSLIAGDTRFRIDSTTTPEALEEPWRSTYEGLRLILAPDLQLQFLGISTDSLRQEWVRRYWVLRDPTPTSPENERRAEHESRVAYALREFPWRERPFWDDRGDIWIPFGAPDSVIEHSATVEEGLGFVPARQEWLYLNEKWVVEFERPNPRGPWRLGRSSAKRSQRPDLVERDKGRLWYNPDPDAPRGPEFYEQVGDIIGFQDDRTLLAEGDYEGLDAATIRHSVSTDLRARNLLKRRSEAVVNFRKQYESGGERFLIHGKSKQPLWYVFDIDVFKGPPGRMRVEVHYQLNLQDLQFTWQDSIYAARYFVEAALVDRDVRETARDTYVERVTADAFRTTMAAQLIPGQLVFEVPTGSYRMSIRLADLGSEAEGTYTTQIEVPRLDGHRLALSDIQMATSIVYAGDDWRSRFIKKDRLVIPNPIAIYARGKTLTGYVEIYGLSLAEDGMCRYQMTYTIAPRGIARTEGWFPDPAPVQKPFVTASFNGDGGTRELVEELRIDVGALASDNYEFVLHVRDLVGGGEATSRTVFTILD